MMGFLNNTPPPTKYPLNSSDITSAKGVDPNNLPGWDHHGKLLVCFT